ncbi:hypothetical protein PInf_024203 [Phytophthora infestans]|nr:hypothetical protein PInf_024203 [Phytophthora infestans]
MKTIAILAVFAYAAALAAADEPSLKGAATAEAEIAQVDGAAKAAATEDHEWNGGGGYGGRYGGYGGYGGYRRRWGGK